MAWLELSIEIQDAQKIDVGGILNAARWGFSKCPLTIQFWKFVAWSRDTPQKPRRSDAHRNQLGRCQASKYQARIAIRPLPSSERELEPENVNVVREIRVQQWLPPFGLFFDLAVGDTSTTNSY